MYHALRSKFVLRSYHSRYQILLLHSCDNACNVAHVTKGHWWNICLLALWFRNNCLHCFYYAYRGAAKTLRVCQTFFIKFNVITERVVISVSFCEYCAIGGNNKISASDFMQSVTTKQRTERLTSCNDYITLGPKSRMVVGRLFKIVPCNTGLTSWSRVLLENLTGPQLVKKFLAF
jgi:hypothetical protein